MTTIPAPSWHVIETPCTTCDSGATVAVAPAHRDRARCEVCIKAGKVPAAPLLDITPHAAPPGKPAPFAPAARKPAKVAPVLPAPERTNRDPMPDGLVIPGPVADMRARAESAGWSVRLGYSVGYVPHGSTGAPIRHGGRLGIQCLHPTSRARVVGIYYLDGKAWEGGFTLANRSGVVTSATVGDAQEFIDLCGATLHIKGWHAVRAAHRAEVARERAANKPKTEKTSTAKRREHGG